MNDNNQYGICSICGTNLLPVWVPLKCQDMTLRRSTKYYWGVDYLSCPNCLCRECVDDSFDREITRDQYLALGGR